MSQSTYTTPEEYLTRTIRRELRKEDHDEFKRHSQSAQASYDSNFGVKFAEPIVIVSSTGTLCPGYVVTTPGMQVPIMVTKLPDVPEYIATISTSTSTPSSTTRTGYYVPSPDYLTTRNIGSVVEKSRKQSYGPAKCGVLSCRIDHSEHYCNVCGSWNTSHPEEDCPRYKNRRY